MECQKTTMKSQQEIVEDFEIFEDWMEKYQYIIDLGKDLDKLNHAEKTDDNKLQGCQSQVWIVHKLVNNKVQFKAESDAAIVAGLVALVLSVYSDKTPAEILATEPVFIAEIGLDKYLSPTRSNGLSSLLTRIRVIAKDYC
ncbi:Sulfur acceptor protein =_ iron-sulfur cluster assembly SufE [hydrothermal vent metagenome]|uniref:Sulfur acceptor protein => iron-sulfur cluster assembly SufE n=1 Tax=hydrothermal vent metagenome TaxID=652676 RepID=A0A3B0WT76_9ZZZZ